MEKAVVRATAVTGLVCCRCFGVQSNLVFYAPIHRQNRKLLLSRPFCSTVNKPTSHQTLLLQLFSQLDKDQSGFIDRNELKQLYENARLPARLLERMVDSSFAAADLNQDGKISFSEFEKQVFGSQQQQQQQKLDSSSEVLDPQKKLKEVFDDLDRDGSGYIDRSELKLAFRRSGIPVGLIEGLVDSTFKSAHNNIDGKISLAEFKDSIFNK